MELELAHSDIAWQLLNAEESGHDGERSHC